MVTENKEEVVFDAKYVKELREEAAKYRLQLRELETKVAQGDVEKELMKRGVMAEAGWVKVAEGQPVSEAVDSFIEKYPHLVSAKDEPKPSDVASRKSKLSPPMSSGKTESNRPGPRPSGNLDRNMSEIKQDPKARAALRQQYQELLSAASHRGNGE